MTPYKSCTKAKIEKKKRKKRTSVGAMVRLCNGKFPPFTIMTATVTTATHHTSTACDAATAFSTITATINYNNTSTVVFLFTTNITISVLPSLASQPPMPQDTDHCHLHQPNKTYYIAF